MSRGAPLTRVCVEDERATVGVQGVCEGLSKDSEALLKLFTLALRLNSWSDFAFCCANTVVQNKEPILCGTLT